MESKLKHEQLMHTVTKNQLKSVEDENMKLRKRILAGGAGARRTQRYLLLYDIVYQLTNVCLVHV